MATIKTSGAVTEIQSRVSSLAQPKNLVETSAIVLIGTLISTGAPFQRAFPTITVANEWLTTGGAADVDVSRVESITFVK